MAFGLAAYNLIQLFFFPRISLLYYVCYLIFSGLCHSFVSGYLKQFIWQDENLLSNHMGLLSVQLAFLSAYGFVYCFLGLRKKMPRATIGVLLFSSITIASIFVNALGYYTIVGASNLLLLLFGTLYLLVISVWLAAKGDRQAIYFSASWACMVIGVLTVTLMISGVLLNPLTQYSSQIGTGLQMILMSFGIADKVKQSEKTYENGKRACSQAATENGLSSPIKSDI